MVISKLKIISSIDEGFVERQVEDFLNNYPVTEIEFFASALSTCHIKYTAMILYEEEDE